jgi:hypothetical protein
VGVPSIVNDNRPFGDKISAIDVVCCCEVGHTSGNYGAPTDNNISQSGSAYSMEYEP